MALPGGGGLSSPKQISGEGMGQLIPGHRGTVDGMRVGRVWVEWKEAPGGVIWWVERMHYTNSKNLFAHDVPKYSLLYIFLAKFFMVVLGYNPG